MHRKLRFVAIIMFVAMLLPGCVRTGYVLPQSNDQIVLGNPMLGKLNLYISIQSHIEAFFLITYSLIISYCRKKFRQYLPFFTNTAYFFNFLSCVG